MVNIFDFLFKRHKLTEALSKQHNNTSETILTLQRLKPSMENYFIGEQYKCQEKCITLGYWTDWRIKYENDNGSRPVLEWALTMIDLTKNLSILDIGCGPSQKINKYFGQHQNFVITGLDSNEAVKLARQFNPSGFYYECDLDSDKSISETSNKIKDTYDIIFCLDVIEHVLFPEKILNLIWEKSRPETMIFLTTLERDLSRSAAESRFGSGKPEHVREWNLQEFTEFIQAFGFIIHKSKITPQPPEQFCQTLLCNRPRN
jgi:2-polyprenyl-3-methyl-5-hydroxy-6-metoxy-1,4-benzoquinol methylase